MFEPSERKIVKRTAPKTTRIVNLNGRLPQAIEAESSLERDFVRRAALNPRISEIVHQPYRIPLESGRYTPDFLLRWADGGRDVVEVKPRRKNAGYRTVFDTVAAMVAERGGRFLVVDEHFVRAGNAQLRAARILRYLKDSSHPKR